MSDQQLGNEFGELSSSYKENKINLYILLGHKMRFRGCSNFLIKFIIFLQLLIYGIVKRLAYVFNVSICL